jgi:peptide/nickel transport system permease protein
MFNLLLRRVLYMLATLFICSVIVFVAVEALPGDAATAQLGQFATDESLALTRTKYGLDQPAVIRYFNWLGGAVVGDLGVSVVRDQPVSDLIGLRLRNTAVLAGLAAAVGIPLAILLGVFAGLMRDKWPDLLVSTIAIAGMTFPDYVTATLMIYFFAIRLELLPAIVTAPTNVPISELIPNMVLPVATLTFIMVAHILRLVRTSMIDVMISDYVQMARLKGVPAMRIIFQHALPNAMLPTINIVALTIAWLLGGVLIIETVYNFPGIGTLMINAITDRDLFLVQGIAIILAGMYIIVNFTADILTLLLNPRLRTSRGH